MFTILVVILTTAIAGLALAAVMAKNVNVSDGLRHLEDMEQMMRVRRGDRDTERARRTWSDPRSTSGGTIAG